MAEYGIVVGGISLKPGIENAPSDQVAQGLTVSINEATQHVVKGLPSLKGGGWDIISHHLTKLGNELYISFLIHR